MRPSVPGRNGRWIGVAAMIALCSGAAAFADEIVVPTQMPLSVALASAQDGDVITLLPSGSPYQQFPGFGFAQKQLTIRGSTGDPADVVLDGAGLDIVLRISGAGADGSVIDSVTFRNGMGPAATNSSGAGVHLNGADVAFHNCVFRDNSAPASDANGIGLYATQSSVRIEGCLFEHNTGPADNLDGAGLYLNGGDHVILRTVFRGNGVEAGTAPAVGGIGGGVYADGGSALLTACTFEGNRAGHGGAIAGSGSETFTIDACVFADNESLNGGAFWISSAAGGAAPRLRNCLMTGNTASVNDAAVFTNKGAIITNCTFAQNATTGSYVIGGSPPAGSVIVDNCVIWGNDLNAANGVFPAPMQAVVRRCILQQPYTGGTGSGFNMVEDPVFTNAATADYSLSASSPAIDAGDSNLYFGPFADLAGNDRAVDVPGVADTGYSIAGPVIDIGAFEVQTAPPPPECAADINLDGTVTSQDFFDFLTAFFAGC